jgi:hypothetical protein
MLLLQSKLLHVALWLLAAFIPLAVFFGPVNLYIFVGSLLFTTSIAVVIVYWPALMLAFDLTVEEIRLVDILTMSIVITFFTIAVREGYVTLWREFFPLPGAGRPDEFYLPLAFTRYTALSGGLLALAAMNTERGNSFMYNLPGWPRAVLAVAVGSIMGAVLIALHP